jgi:hypothetical protein
MDAYKRQRTYSRITPESASVIVYASVIVCLSDAVCLVSRPRQREQLRLAGRYQ